MNKTSILTNFLNWAAKMAGNPITFIFAFFLVILWLVIGLIQGLTDMWLLILNTIATVNATLMVFIIQNTQTRESKALHLKIDELIRATKEATDELIASEELEEEELEKIKSKLFPKVKRKSEKE